MKPIKTLLLVTLTAFFLGCSEDTIDDTGTGDITGVVVTQGNNEPVENARISTTPASSTVFTDEKGEFSLQNIPAGEYSVEARKEGLLTQFEGTNLTADNTVSMVFEMQPETGNNRQPSAPEAAAPEDKATGVSVTTDFVWTAADPDDDELVYSLEIRNDRDERVFMFDGIQDTTYTVEGLDFGNKYFWQVTASDEINAEVKSSIFSFTTMDVPESRVLFTRIVGGNNVIFARDGEGNEFQLTSSDRNSFRPRKNNSRNRIAFLRTIGGQTHLFTMNPNGSDQRQVTFNVPVRGFNLDRLDFSWAADGSSLIYPNFDRLYQVNASGGGTRLVHQTADGSFITEVAAAQDSQRIVLITNNPMGYDASIYAINFNGEVQQQILTEVEGALGGLDISLQDRYLLYVRDISGYEDDSSRRLDSRIMLYDFESGTTTDLSGDKPNGTNDLDPRFSPNEASVIFVNTSNDGISRKDIYTVEFDLNTGEDEETVENRTLLQENASMPDWE